MTRHVEATEVKGNRAFGLGKGHKTQTLKKKRISRRIGVSFQAVTCALSIIVVSLVTAGVRREEKEMEALGPPVFAVYVNPLTSDVACPRHN